MWMASEKSWSKILPNKLKFKKVVTIFGPIEKDNYSGELQVRDLVVGVVIVWESIAQRTWPRIRLRFFSYSE